MVILIAILVWVFLRYVEETERVVEDTARLQAKRVIDSALTVVFATHAVQGRLDDLGRLDGANPFEVLAEYDIEIAGYNGVVEPLTTAAPESGWYFDASKKMACFQSRVGAPRVCYRLTLHYDDRDGSGRFEAKADRFKGLRFDAVGS